MLRHRFRGRSSRPPPAPPRDRLPESPGQKRPILRHHCPFPLSAPAVVAVVAAVVEEPPRAKTKALIMTLRDHVNAYLFGASTAIMACLPFRLLASPCNKSSSSPLANPAFSGISQPPSPDLSTVGKYPDCSAQKAVPRPRKIPLQQRNEGTGTRVFHGIFVNPCSCTPKTYG